MKLATAVGYFYMTLTVTLKHLYGLNLSLRMEKLEMVVVDE